MNTNVFHHTLHRSLWQWLADNPSKSKEGWTRWESNGGDVEVIWSHCFACKYAKECGTCYYCPLVWGGKYDRCFVNNGLFGQWQNSTDPHERTDLALKIKDLPVKDGVVCD
jgi:hypothetical protein